MRKLFIGCLSVPVVTVAMTMTAYAGGGGGEASGTAWIIHILGRTIGHIVDLF